VILFFVAPPANVEDGKPNGCENSGPRCPIGSPMPLAINGTGRERHIRHRELIIAAN
jgi:hypothetical protein